jgi:hypothetical protein
MTSSKATLHQQRPGGVGDTFPRPGGGGQLLTPAVPLLHVRVFRKLLACCLGPCLLVSALLGQE